MKAVTVISALVISLLPRAALNAANYGTKAVAGAGVTALDGNGYRIYDDTGLQPAASSSAEAHLVTAVEGFGTHPIIADAEAYVNLATGRMGVSASSVSYGKAIGYAELLDRLTFDIDGATASSVTPITIDLTYHGVFGPIGPSGSASASYQLLLQPNGGPGTTGSAWFNRGPDDWWQGGPTGWASYSVTPMQGDLVRFTGVYNLLGVNPEINLAMRMTALTSHNASADFSNTASVNFILPTGVTYTSASGLFLSEANAVPEPSTWAMMIAGFGLVGGAMRRRSAPSAAAV